MDSAGNVVVVWPDYGPNAVDDADDAVQARRFDASGMPLGPQFAVNATPVSSPNAHVALAPDGAFVVAWGRFDAELETYVGQARRFDATGNPVTGEIELGPAYDPRVAVDPTGGFAAAWSGAFLRRFDATDTPTGPVISVNEAPGDHRGTMVAVQPSGHLVVVWCEELLDSNGVLGKLGRTLGRRFDADGVPGPQFVLSDPTTYRRTTPSITVLPADGYFAVWTNSNNAGERGNVAGRFWRPAQPVGNAKIAIRDNADATKRKVVFQAKSPQIATRATIGMQAATDGLSVHVFNTHGTGDAACLMLPAGPSWTTSGTVLDPAFRYRDASYANGSCKTAILRPGRIKVTCQATVQPISYSLDEPMQGGLAVRVRSGDVTYCTDFGGAILKDEPSSFKAKRADAPTDCFAPPVGCP